jgi:hypothetical protein
MANAPLEPSRHPRLSTQEAVRMQRTSQFFDLSWYKLRGMLHIPSRHAKTVGAEHEIRGPINLKGSAQQFIALTVLLSTIALAYFYVVDNYYFSTKLMTPIFSYLLMVNDFNTVWLALGVCVAAAFWRNSAPILKVVDFLGNHATVTALAAVALLACGAVFIYHNNALCMDEYAAVFQAKVFATGRLFAQLPPSVVDWLLPPGFNGMFIVASRATGRAIESYWPGFSLVLAPFELLGIPWLCNASLAGLGVFLIYRITLQITDDRRAAGWAVFFTLCSGAFVANAISYYSMQAHLTANLLFAWLLFKPTPYRAFAAGVVGSLALVLHNPFPHALFAAPWIVSIARSNKQLRSFLALVLGYLPVLIFVGAGWLQLRAYVTAGDSGFNFIGMNVSGDFSLPDKSMIDMRVAAMVKMWLWAVPGLYLFAVLGRIRHGDDQHVRLLTQSAAVTFVAYLFVIFDQGHGWGYRYFHSAWGVIPILAGCAMSRRSGLNDRLAAFAGASALMSLFLIVPYQMTQIDSMISRHLAQLPPLRRPGNNVYFIGVPGGFYSADLIQMDPLLRDQDLILFSRGAQLDAELRRQNWPTATLVERGFRVEEWNLGPKDQRRSPLNSSGSPRFEISFSEHANPGNTIDAEILKLKVP